MSRRAREAVNVYEESEAQFRKLRRAEYADWVARSFPWKTWGDAPWDEVDHLKYIVIARAPFDPERSSREDRISRGVGFGKQWSSARHVPLAEYEKAFLKATSDGRPRTLHRIVVEAFDMEADMIPRVAQLAVMRLIYEEKLAFALVPVQGRNRRGEVILLWNDATWRRNHPEWPRPRRVAPLELPPAWMGQAPLAGTVEQESAASAPRSQARTRGRIRQVSLYADEA